jgi:hypothetical protein
LRPDQGRVEDECFEPRHIGSLDFSPERDDLATHFVRRGPTGGVNSGDDPTGMRFDHLRAVAKVNFVTVVVRRIVACRNHHARARAQIADSEGKLRRRSRSVEDEGVAAVFRRDLGRELREIRRKKRVSCAMTSFGLPLSFSRTNQIRK